MITPTQAQIAAAIEAFSKSAGYPIDARVADGSMLRANIIAALIAAAEAEGLAVDSLISATIENVKTETIERCAQVADEWGEAGAVIAAAIRALLNDSK